jgi:tetratricopeptide (TPR) repeat protein
VSLKKQLLMVAGALLAVAVSGHWWFPRVLAVVSVTDNQGTIQTWSGLASGIIALVGVVVAVWAVIVAKKQLALAQDQPPVPPSVRVEAAGSRAIAVGGNVSGTLNAGDQNIQASNIIGNIEKSGDVVAGDKIVVLPSPAQVPTPHQLSPPPADFTGREAELHELVNKIERGGVTISGLRGIGGIGKTALALKLGELLRPQFPDGQIYIDLKGFDSKMPLTPAEAQARVIRSFHPDAAVPDDADAAGNLYRSVLDGKRAFLLMDNARDAAQVEPLTPPAGSVIVVTSRNSFTLPGLFAKDLDTLPPADARDLLLKIAPRIGECADDVAKLCGYLALALRAAASLISETPSLDPAEYTTRLSDERKRLLRLKGERIDVEASIGLSYELLKAETALVLRQLAVFPASFDATAEEKVCLDGDHAHLDELVRKSLVQYNPESRRYVLHDLVRVFAGAKLTEDERAAAERGHAAHYETVLRAARGSYEQGGEGVLGGLKLFDREWPNIQAGQAWVARHADDDNEAAQLCSSYPDAGLFVLELRQHPRDRIKSRETALAAARQLGARSAEGAHLGNLGLAYSDLGEYRRAIEYHEQHLTIAREIGDRRGESGALGNLGSAYCSLGEYRRATEYYEQQLAIAREIGHRRGEGNALTGLGIAYDSLGEYRRAIEYHEQHLTIAREIGDRMGEGRGLNGLGNAYYSLGEYRSAIEYHEQRLAIAQEIGDRRGECTALLNLSLTLDQIGNREEAIKNAEASLKIHEEIEDPWTDKVRKKLAEWKAAPQK